MRAKFISADTYGVQPLAMPALSWLTATYQIQDLQCYCFVLGNTQQIYSGTSAEPEQQNNNSRIAAAEQQQQNSSSRTVTADQQQRANSR
ncbi:hypothetical protein ACLKA6_008005 [Drosophila palustris]